ncbi:hypothetical protein INR49_000321, partial [Caranx melampygus]
MLRASGIYYVPKGKTKHHIVLCCLSLLFQSSSDLACFVRFEKVNIYNTSNYKQKYKAPTDFCFILKHPCIQKESDYIKFLCCNDKHTLLLWMNSIRIAKYGALLYNNYQAAMKRVSALQTLQTAAHKDKSRGPAAGNSPRPDPAPSKVKHVEDYSHEPPPDFIPPPPPVSIVHDGLDVVSWEESSNAVTDAFKPAVIVLLDYVGEEEGERVPQTPPCPRVEVEEVGQGCLLLQEESRGGKNHSSEPVRGICGVSWTMGGGGGGATDTGAAAPREAAGAAERQRAMEE